MNHSLSWRATIFTAVATTFTAGSAAAGTYVGAAIGQSRIAASDASFGSSQFIEHDTALKLTVGIKGPLGLELEYLDFGKADGLLNGDAARGKLNSLAAFALVPIPDFVPVLDVYGKVGFARLDTSVNTALLDFDSRGTEFAWGLGLRYEFGSLGVRAEYERFKRGGRDPAALTLGVVKYFHHD